MDIGATGLGLIDYAIFIAALIAMLVIGIRAGGKIKSLEDYALSKEHKFSTSVLAMTLIVTMIGSNSSMGAIAEIYKDGVIYFVHELFCVMACLFLVQHAAKFMTNRYSKAISLYGIIEQEYGVTPAKIASGISIFVAIISLSMQMIAMGYITKTFLGIPFYVGLVGISVVFIIYSSLGGIRAVVYTDVLQFFIILIVFPILLGVLVYNIGGLKAVFEALPQEKTRVYSSSDFTEYVYLTLFWMMPFGLIIPSFIQRVLMCRGEKETQQAGLSWVLFKFVFVLIVGLVGLASISLLPSTVTGKEVIPALMKDFLPVSLKGLAITAFMAVIMSSADSILNSVTVLIAEMLKGTGEEKGDTFDMGEIHSNLEEAVNKKKDNIWGLKLSSMFVGLVSLAIAMLDFSFIRAVTISSAIAFAAVNIPIFFAPFKDRRQKAVKAYLSSSIGGFGAFLILWLTLGQSKMYMVSFYSTFFAILGWFIGAIFLDKIKTNFWHCMRDAYAPKFNIRILLDTTRGHVYFVVFAIVTFLLRYMTNVWLPFATGNVIISSALLASCLLLLVLYFGDKIKTKNHKLFVFLWLLTLFIVLPLYNTIAVLQYPDQQIEVVGLVISILILNLILSWRLSTLMLLAAFGISSYLNKEFYHQEAIFVNFEYVNLAIYVTISGIIITMILKKVYDNVALEKLEYSDAMACSIAHELKSPVAHSGVLVRGYPVKNLEDINVFREKLDKVQRQSSDVISRTTQIFTQGTSSDIVNEDVNVKDLFDQVMMGNLYSRQYRERIKVNIEPDFVVYAYPNNLFTILENLLKNAYKYALVKKKDAQLNIYTEGNQLIFHDTGPGISSDCLLTIFDKGVTYNPTGTGFGLYYCKIEMERLGGSVTCESKEGKFTKFILTFPKKVKGKKKPTNN
jgi:Na+/pantothenate symporter/signal transduction histidine kinase